MNYKKKVSNETFFYYTFTSKEKQQIVSLIFYFKKHKFNEYFKFHS